jgi:hypothetical protein
MGSMQPFTLLPPVLNQSFINGGNADKAPFLNLSTVQPATRPSSSLCAINSHQHHLFDIRFQVELT